MWSYHIKERGWHSLSILHLESPPYYFLSPPSLLVPPILLSYWPTVLYSLTSMRNTFTEWHLPSVIMMRHGGVRADMVLAGAESSTS